MTEEVMTKYEVSIKSMVNEILKVFHLEMDKMLDQETKNSIKEHEVLIHILNILTNVSSNIYYSIKAYLPDAELDYPFIKAKTLNTLADLFEDIKNFNYADKLMRLTPDQIIELYNNDFVMVKMADGSERKVTKDDVLVKKEDVERYIEKKRQEKKDKTTEIIH